MLLPNHNLHLARFLTRPRQCVQVFQQGKQRCAMDGPTAARAQHDTQLPRDAPLQDLPGIPEWDDALYGPQTRTSRSSPSHVPAPTSVGALPPLKKQMKGRLMPGVQSQGRPPVLQLIWNDVHEYKWLGQGDSSRWVAADDRSYLRS